MYVVMPYDYVMSGNAADSATSGKTAHSISSTIRLKNGAVVLASNHAHLLSF